MSSYSFFSGDLICVCCILVLKKRSLTEREGDKFILVDIWSILVVFLVALMMNNDDGYT